MAISMLKIRRPLGRLIFNMGIAIPGKTIFLIETAPWVLSAPDGPQVGPMNLAIRVCSFAENCSAGQKRSNGICENCGMDYYQPMANQDHCIACPNNFKTSGTQSTAESDCKSMYRASSLTITDSTDLLIDPV